MLFDLTDEHLRTGRLTEDDYSELAGQKVYVLNFWDFPHAAELGEKKKLTPQKNDERAKAIAQRCIELGIFKKNMVAHDTQAPALNDQLMRCDGGGLSTAQYTRCKDIASTASSGVSFFRDFIDDFDADPFWHFEVISDVGDFPAVHDDPSSSLWIRQLKGDGSFRSLVFPGFLNEPISVQRSYVMDNSIVMQGGTAEDESRDWAQFIKMSSRLPCHAPQEGLFGLMEDLHESRHLQQITACTNGPFSEVALFYKELDADMAARAIMQKKGVGEKTTEAYLNARYVNMLFSSDSYWFADTLEALEQGRYPQNYFKTAASVLELHVRIAQSFSRRPMDHVASSEIQGTIAHCCRYPNAPQDVSFSQFDLLQNLLSYDTIAKRFNGHDTAPIFTHLRRIKEQGDITDSFTNKLSGRILSAAYAFRPELLYADQERPSFRRADRVYGDCRFG